LADTVLAGVSDFVRRFVRRLPLLRFYPGKVVSQSEVGATVDFMPDDAAELGQGGFSGIPLALGLPGFEVKAEGARVHLLFGGADPSRPRAALYDQHGPVDEIRFDGGTKAIARVDDTVDCGQLWLVTVNVSGVDVVSQLWYRPPGGSWAPVMAAPIPPTPVTPGTPIDGVIESGNEKFKA
jgi:hypothetical protein